MKHRSLSLRLRGSPKPWPRLKNLMAEPAEVKEYAVRIVQRRILNQLARRTRELVFQCGASRVGQSPFQKAKIKELQMELASLQEIAR
jgi:hypothetical protein